MVKTEGERTTRKARRLGKRSPGTKRKVKRRRVAVGWREWVELPDLGVRAIKAKLDTGARTSALHAFNIEPVVVDGKRWVRFEAHPLQQDDATVMTCVVRPIDRRWITNPGGRREKRFIIKTTVRLGGREWPIELSLTNRDHMGFRLLIGRAAMQRRLIVDPEMSYMTGTPTEAKIPPPSAARRRKLRAQEEEE